MEFYAHRSLCSNKYLTNVNDCFVCVFSEQCIKLHVLLKGVKHLFILLGFLDDHKQDQVHMQAHFPSYLLARSVIQ